MKHILFFALKEDLTTVLNAVEEKGPLKYARMGRCLERNLSFYKSGNEIPNLGKANNESASGCQSYLVAEPNTDISLRPKKDGSGADYFLIDQLENPDTVTFTPAGLWNDEVVLHGRVATVSNSAPAQELMKRFHSAIKKHFTKIKAYWVGPEAHKLFVLGKRLTIAEQSPHGFDLTP